MCMMYTAFWKSKLAELTASTSKLLKIPVEAYYKRCLCSIRMTKDILPCEIQSSHSGIYKDLQGDTNKFGGLVEMIMF